MEEAVATAAAAGGEGPPEGTAPPPTLTSMLGAQREEQGRGRSDFLEEQGETEGEGLRFEIILGSDGEGEGGGAERPAKNVFHPASFKSLGHIDVRAAEQEDESDQEEEAVSLPSPPVAVRGAGYGLDVEIQAKLADKYEENLDLELMAQGWIEVVTDEMFEHDDFGQSLKDGVLLCKLVNNIKPGTIPHINESPSAFKQMENISRFLRACRDLGVAEHSLFETVDLFECKDLGLVVSCIYQLGVAVQTTVPSFGGPHLGDKSMAATLFSPEHSRVGGAGVSSPASPSTSSPPTMFATRKSPGPSLPQTREPCFFPKVGAALSSPKGAPGGQEAEGHAVDFQVVPPPRVTSITALQPGIVPQQAAAGGEGSAEKTQQLQQQQDACPLKENSEPAMRSGLRGVANGAYGLDHDLARKREISYDCEAERAASEWVQAVTGEQFEATSFGENLRDGRRLCQLVNKIQPDIVKKVNVSTLAFKQMENISLFLRACRQLGVAEHSLFETVDLYEMKDLNVVVTCLYALGQTVQTTVPDFQGPHLGARSPSCVSSRRGSGGLVMRERLLPR